jgi:hypothetical protein
VRLAVQFSGRKYPGRWKARRWPREKIPDAIWHRARHGRSVASGVIESKLSGLWEAGGPEFGSWKSAVRAAGVEYPRREWKWKWPPLRILDLIRKRISRGQSLRAGHVHSEEKGLLDAAKRTFGSWARAIREAGARR